MDAIVNFFQSIDAESIFGFLDKIQGFLLWFGKIAQDFFNALP